MPVLSIISVQKSRINLSGIPKINNSKNLKNSTIFKTVIAIMKIPRNKLRINFNLIITLKKNKKKTNM